MATFGTWIKRTFQQVLDPDREQRIQEVATLMHRSLQKNREKFSLAAFAEHVQCSQQDIECAKRDVYQTLLDRAWRDGKIAADEQRVLKWAVSRLEIPLREAQEVQHRIAVNHFADALARAMDDGFIDDHEAGQLSNIAQSIEYSLSDFVNKYFHMEGENFLRGIFAACTEGGMLAADAWARLINTTDKLGFSRESLSAAILPQAERFIEHVIADAKSDGEFSENEEQELLNLVRILGIPESSRIYIDNTISGLRVIRLARQGQLPVIDCPEGLAIRAGEMCICISRRLGINVAF